MANVVLKPDPLEELRLVAPQAPDRLPAMLFLAALIHGILIIGISFNPEIVDQFAEAISLEVTIVADPDQRIDAPEDAAYLAQASQRGGGNTSEQVRPSAPLESALPVDNPGREDGTALVDATAHERSADDIIASPRDTNPTVTIDPRTEPKTIDSRAIAMEAGSEVTLPLPQEEERASMLIHDDEPRELIVSADTRESVVAAYLDSWKRRVEAVGDSYLPELGDLGGLSGSPTLMVTIDASGDLRDAIIRKTSGSTVLDLAALDILRRSSPFNPFPPEIAADYDTVRFEYKWLFADQRVPTAAIND